MKKTLQDLFEVDKKNKVNNYITDDYSIFEDKALLDTLRNKIIQNIIDNNIPNGYNLNEYINVLKKILPNKMKEYLIKAYDLYLNDEEYTEADEYFFEHEYEIIDLLQDYSNTIKGNNI